MDGFETAEQIRRFGEKIPIIFITTSKDFAVQSYGVLAFDYLLKPVTEDDMVWCLSHFSKLMPDQRCLCVNYMGGFTDILLSNIIYPALTAEADFCRCHKSFFVNSNYIDAISGEDFCLMDGTLLQISRTCSSEAKKKYFDHIFGKGDT